MFQPIIIVTLTSQVREINKVLEDIKGKSDEFSIRPLVFVYNLSSPQLRFIYPTIPFDRDPIQFIFSTYNLSLDHCYFIWQDADTVTEHGIYRWIDEVIRDKPAIFF